MAESSTSQIDVDGGQINPSANVTDNAAEPANDPEQTPKTNTQPLEHVPEDDPELKLKQHNTELKAQLAKLKEENLNFKRFLKKKEQDYREVKILLADAVLSKARQDADLENQLQEEEAEQEALLASIQSSRSAQLRESYASRRARSSVYDALPSADSELDSYFGTLDTYKDAQNSTPCLVWVSPRYPGTRIWLPMRPPMAESGASSRIPTLGSSGSYLDTLDAMRMRSTMASSAAGRASTLDSSGSYLDLDAMRSTMAASAAGSKGPTIGSSASHLNTLDAYEEPMDVSSAEAAYLESVEKYDRAMRAVMAKSSAGSYPDTLDASMYMSSTTTPSGVSSRAPTANPSGSGEPSSSSKGKGKGKEKAVEPEANPMADLNAYFENRHLLSREDQRTMLETIIANMEQKKGIRQGEDL
ncbi:hypothetical protein CPB84DRAFT_1746728 [Gymnopilus junonius]|uniref:Uncharacterized protein n=1 Tax=Gymnopilus junonius TaxID=109634 RepID=A0A9P5NQN3_GYMJU|nr:hypothetical protein CPB84DRAFT_1746728 [Gymnopilus junonius]